MLPVQPDYQLSLHLRFKQSPTTRMEQPWRITRYLQDRPAASDYVQPGWHFYVPRFGNRVKAHEDGNSGGRKSQWAEGVEFHPWLPAGRPRLRASLNQRPTHDSQIVEPSSFESHRPVNGGLRCGLLYICEAAGAVVYRQRRKPPESNSQHKRENVQMELPLNTTGIRRLSEPEQ